MDVEEKQSVLEEFNEWVNMSPDEHEQWLKSDCSRDSSIHFSGSLSDNRAGWRVVELKRKHPEQFEENDFDLMMRAVGFIKRQAFAEPYGYINASQWRYTLMNWGHDPLKR